MSFKDLLATLFRPIIRMGRYARILALIALFPIYWIFGITIGYFNHKPESYRIAEVILEWYQTPQEQGGFAEKPLKQEGKPAYLQTRDVKNLTVTKNQIKSIVEYITNHHDTPNTRSSNNYAGVYTKKGHFIIEIDEESSTVVILSRAIRHRYRYLWEFRTFVKLPGTMSDVKMKSSLTMFKGRFLMFSIFRRGGTKA